MGLDERLFRLINQRSQNPLFDAIMPWLSDGGVVRLVLILVGVGILAAAYRRGEPAGIQTAWRVVLTAVIAVIVADFIGARLLKPLFARPRPPFAMDDVRRLVGVGPSFSFPSNHAINTATVGAVVMLEWPRWGWLLLGVAAVVGYSRVYVGVHYPFDVIGGAVLGLAIGAGFRRIARRWA